MTYKDEGAESTILPDPVKARKKSKTTPRDKEDQSSAAVVVRQKFGRRLENQGYHEESSAYGDVNCPDCLSIDNIKRIIRLGSITRHSLIKQCQVDQRSQIKIGHDN